jgi:predicted nucleotidyltransferase
MNKTELIKYLTDYLKSQGVEKASLFGSAARNEDTTESDIDILVQLPKGKSLLDLVGLKLDLEESLHRNVDILTYNSVHPLIRDYIFHDAVVLYE